MSTTATVAAISNFEWKGFAGAEAFADGTRPFFWSSNVAYLVAGSEQLEVGVAEAAAGGVAAADATFAISVDGLHPLLVEAMANRILAMVDGRAASGIADTMLELGFAQL